MFVFSVHVCFTRKNRLVAITKIFFLYKSILYSFAVCSSQVVFTPAQSNTSLLGFIIEQVCNNNGCVINHLFFPHPPHTGFFYHDIYCLGGPLLCLGHLYGFVIFNKFPKSIRGNDQEFISNRVKFTLGEFWFRWYTRSMCNGISKGSRCDSVTGIRETGQETRCDHNCRNE